MTRRPARKEAAVSASPPSEEEPTAPLPLWAQRGSRRHTSVDSTSLFLRSFLDEPMTLPPFQRSFCWQAEDVRGLLDSLLHGLPIGSILVWVGDGSRWFWQHALIIDGLQRRTALRHLFGIEAQPGLPDFGIDLRTGQVVELADDPLVLPSKIMFDWKELALFIRRLFNGNFLPGFDLVTTADTVRDVFQDVRIPLITLRGDEAFAREAFRRLNTAGHPIAFDEVMACLKREEWQPLK